MPDLTTRPVHADHRKGVVHLIREALALKGDDAPESARRILARCFAEDMTYAELPTLGERAVTRAIDRVLPDADIPETRVDELIAAVRSITPDRRVCPKCGRLDLTRVAGRWSPQSGDYCLAENGQCRGVFARVTFPADVIAWTDGTSYPPGTTHDRDGFPITDNALAAHLCDKGGSVHAWVTSALAATPTVSLTAFAYYLLRTGAGRGQYGALRVLMALADPYKEGIAMNADGVLVLARRAADDVRMTTPTPPPGTTVVVSTERRYELTEIQRFRGPLVTLYPDVASVRRIVSDAGVRTSNINLSGAPRDIWHNALVEANAHGRIDAIVAIALREYPNNPALRALGGA